MPRTKGPSTIFRDVFSEELLNRSFIYKKGAFYKMDISHHWLQSVFCEPYWGNKYYRIGVECLPLTFGPFDYPSFTKSTIGCDLDQYIISIRKLSREIDVSAEMDSPYIKKFGSGDDGIDYSVFRANIVDEDYFRYSLRELTEYILPELDSVFSFEDALRTRLKMHCQWQFPKNLAYEGEQWILSYAFLDDYVRAYESASTAYWIYKKECETLEELLSTGATNEIVVAGKKEMMQLFENYGILMSTDDGRKKVKDIAERRVKESESEWESYTCKRKKVKP